MRYEKGFGDCEFPVFDQQDADLMADIRELKRERDHAVRDLCRWRSAIQAMTPGGSEFMDPEVVRDWAERMKRENAQMKLELARLRKASE